MSILGSDSVQSIGGASYGGCGIKRGTSEGGRCVESGRSGWGHEAMREANVEALKVTAVAASYLQDKLKPGGSCL